MHRRAFLHRTINRAEFMPPPPRQDLSAYEGAWTEQEAGHLLRRTLFGASPDQIIESVSLGLEETLNRLLTDLPMPDPPVNFGNENDTYTPIGTTWVDKPYGPQESNNEEVRFRRQSLISWTMQLALEPNGNIR
ncbi:MAG TPA: hypothetical protein PK066_15555, partial [Saprospiraceae bacterium]|nr:hypothetical protein [Saprospiraceae bacterium]